ncbi:hypothetical protein jhhlp_004243 [Lomentospora prolificans]|uniref:Carboxylesterase type B domain-containing protein n=1 Tax=Lomentospora prolificans TaxID=41688 RepID=A0A2N3NB22_9PEZI|nr:hypothetical protein jhhlp_004243 [Lomentospora prolificans]
MSPSVITLQHPALGPIRGKAHNGVVQYLGIKYASLSHRFSIPELYSGAGGSIVTDATQLGPAVIGLPNGCKAEQALIQQTLPLPDFPPQSDTEGLNLTITLPGNPEKSKLPVFVFVHGGGLITGSGTWPQYDHGAFVRRSAELGKPVIGVNINYRTGPLGFLTSEELQTAGLAANNGLRDQKVAFQWIRRFISGFGGDPDQITAIGQSAGAACLTLLLQSDEPLFNRVALLSGTCLAIRPQPTSVHNQVYRRFCEAHNLADGGVDTKMEAINQIDSYTLVANTPPSVALAPALDEFIHTNFTLETIKNNSKTGDITTTIPGFGWCDDLLIGDCSLDGNIHQLALAHRKNDIAKQLEISLKKNIPNHDREIERLLADYGISTAPDDERAYLKVLEFATDIVFTVPNDLFAEAWPKSKYVYHIDEPNPWEGPFLGHATHILDVALLFKNFDEKLDAPARSVGGAFSDNMIKFVNGEAPWKANTTDDPVAFIYRQGVNEVREDTSRSVGRKQILYRLQDSIGLDSILVAFQLFLGGQ